jgi:hypothetical protein
VPEENKRTIVAGVLAVLVMASAGLVHTSYSDTSLDKFGIEKIYATADGGNEWYVDMDDPTSDPLFRNLESMTKQADGSWQVDGSRNGQVRMEAWSPTNEKWLNVEITMYGKIESGSNELFQLYSRGGHHTSRDECLGSAYKARLYGDGRAAWNKEVTHPAYAGNRGTEDVTDTPLADRWVGFKAVIYNFGENGKTYVRMESYIDDDVTDSNGNLKIANNWKLASVVEDKGGWATSDGDFDTSCGRDRDELLTSPGGTASQNIAAFRTDNLVWNFKYLSVREIQPERTPTAGEEQPETPTEEPPIFCSCVLAGQHVPDTGDLTINSITVMSRARATSNNPTGTVEIVQDGEVKGTATFQTSSLRTDYIRITAVFDRPIHIAGDFDVVAKGSGLLYRNQDDYIPGSFFTTTAEYPDRDLVLEVN